MRGIIVSPPMKVMSDGGLLIKKSMLDQDLLRGWLLFWDTIDFPQSNLIQFGLPPDIQFLVDTGVMIQTKARLQGNFSGAEGVLEAYLSTFKHHEKEEPGVWSLAKGENTFSFPNDEVVNDRGIIIKLTNSIPVPSSEVPFEDILRFKKKRESELFALRTYIDELYKEITNSIDKPHAEHAAIVRLEKSIEDYIKSSRNSGFKFRLVDISAKFNLIPALVTGITTSHFGLDTAQALLAGVVAGSSINIGPSIGLKNGQSDIVSPFEYAAKIHSELYL